MVAVRYGRKPPLRAGCRRGRRRIQWAATLVAAAPPRRLQRRDRRDERSGRPRSSTSSSRARASSTLREGSMRSGAWESAAMSSPP